MVGTTVGRVALFSIRPNYARAILDGSKEVEFRRQGLPDDVTHVVIYATAPVQHVLGMFEVAGIDKMTPSEAWKRHGHTGGIEKTAFEQYYTKAEHAFVIRVHNPQTFPTPFLLADLDENLRAPQSYMYLREDVLDRAGVLAAHPQPHVPVVGRLLTSLASRELAPAAR
jgi:predicted transcriptional regulator